MPDPAPVLSILKIPYEGLFRWDNAGVFRGAHHQFREVVVRSDNTVVSEKLLPATPWGTDPDFPLPDLISLVLNDALAENSLRAAAHSEAELVRDAAIAERDAAIAERDAAIAERDAALAENAAAAELARDEAIAARDAAIATRDAALADKAAAIAAAQDDIAQLQSLISALTSQPERPPGKWWMHAAAFLEEFTPQELFAVHNSQVPLIVQLLMTLLAWNGEVWSSDSRITMGLQALVSLGVLTPERRASILAE